MEERTNISTRPKFELTRSNQMLRTAQHLSHIFILPFFFFFFNDHTLLHIHAQSRDPRSPTNHREIPQRHDKCEQTRAAWNRRFSGNPDAR